MVTVTVTLTLLEYTSSLQELLLWNSLSVHAQIDQDKTNTGTVTREGENEREMGAVPERRRHQQRKAHAQRLAVGTTTRHRLGLDLVADGPQHLNQGPNFPCWTRKADPGHGIGAATKEALSFWVRASQATCYISAWIQPSFPKHTKEVTLNMARVCRKPGCFTQQMACGINRRRHWQATVGSTYCIPFQ